MNRRPHRVLREDTAKIMESILHVLAKKPGLTQYEIVKTLFLADRAHLNRYGRPITFDNYVALEHGPVPSLAYDALKPGFNFQSRFGEPRPWASAPEPQSRASQFTALRAPRRELLSATDIEALDDALGTVLSLSFGQLRRLTHEDPAYVEAWDRRGDSMSSDMKLQLLFETDGDEQAFDLAYISEQA